VVGLEVRLLYWDWRYDCCGGTGGTTAVLGLEVRLLYWDWRYDCCTGTLTVMPSTTMHSSDGINYYPKAVMASAVI
jgi:hypothetical protein